MEESKIHKYRNPGTMLSYQEMLMLIPKEILKPEHPKHKTIFGLMEGIMLRLEGLEITSKINPDMHVQTARKCGLMTIENAIYGLQEQMIVIRHRLAIHDYSGALEKKILEVRLNEAYAKIKIIDPDEIAHFERIIDKRMRKARSRGW